MRSNNRKRKKRKLKKQVKKGLIITSIILVILLIIASVLLFVFKNKNNSDNEVNVHVQEEEKEKISKASLIMVGDALIHNAVYNDARRLANYNGYDFKPQVELVKEISSKYDLAYYNQETILGGSELGLSNYPCFNSPYEVGDAMIDAGFNLVSLATNHTIDRGIKATTNSRNYWNSKDVVAMGSYNSFEEKEELETQVHEINGITYAMLNYTYGTNGIPVPYGKEYVVNVWPYSSDSEYEAYKEVVKNDVMAIRDKVDILMVAMHWGVEYTHTPTQYERDQANYLASLGVDIVIGTHPHVIQPVEWIDDTIVFYSLGNFISAQYQNQDSCYNYKCVIGLMSSLDITKREYKGETSITIDNVKNELIYTYYSNWANFRVIPFSNKEIVSKFPNYKNVYETYKNVITNLDSTMYVESYYQ